MFFVSIRMGFVTDKVAMEQVIHQAVRSFISSPVYYRATVARRMDQRPFRGRSSKRHTHLTTREFKKLTDYCLSKQYSLSGQL